tara:strand:- start:109 stop:429 length:321 start_codon:yes stop_codon:yes gene_type:complete
MGNRPMALQASASLLTTHFGRIRMIRIPKRFYDDHCERDLEAPGIVKETKAHYWVAEDEHLEELLSDAKFYEDPTLFACDFGDPLWAICLSAQATVKAIEKHRAQS